MERLNDLSMSRKLILGGAVLLLIDTFFAWQKVSIGVAGVATVEAKANAWHGFWGIVMCLLTIALIAWVAARMLGAPLPAAVPDGLATIVVAFVILAFAVIKNLADDYSAWASYVGIALAALVTYGAWQAYQEGRESLPGTAARPTT